MHTALGVNHRQKNPAAKMHLVRCPLYKVQNLAESVKAATSHCSSPLGEELWEQLKESPMWIFWDGLHSFLLF